MTAPLNPRSWNLGFSSLGCSEFNLDQMIELAQKFQINHIELRSIEDQFNLPDYFSKKFLDRNSAREYFKRNQITIDCLGSSFKWIGAPEGGRQEFIDFCQLAHDLGIPYVRVFGGSSWGTPLTAEDYKTATREYQWWEAQRDQHGWTVQAITEAHDAFSASKPLVQLMESIGKSIPILWDTHHTWRYGGERPLEAWNALKDSIVHIHFKDSIPVPSARHPFTYVLPGQGDFPIAELQSILHSGIYQKTASVEWERKWHPYLDPLEVALEAAQREKWI